MSTVRLFLLVAFLSSFASASFGAIADRAPASKPILSTGIDDVLISSRTGVRYKSTTDPDTFCLYGGPGTIEGKFQGTLGEPGTLGHAPHDIVPGEWFGVDLTEPIPFWQVSTFCAENLDGDGSSGGAGDGPGNQAWWAGRTAEQEPGWAAAPGYGNNWNAQLEWRATMLDPSVGQTIGLTFAFNHETEPGYDYFNVVYDSSYTVKYVASVDASNAPFDAPGVQYPAEVVTRPIVYGPNGYNGDEIILRLTVTSDGAFSDEDGFWPTTCGGAIVDDITVVYTDGVQQHVDFSDIDNTSSWQTPAPYFAGDFSDIYLRFRDIDPCRENTTPAAGFIDYGQCPPNQFNNNGEPPCASTGGMPGGGYGIPGDWGFNNNGGLAGFIAVTNEIWSPPIAWDLPGTEDDDPSIAGAMLRFDSWQDMPILSGVFWQWHVRSSYDDGGTWGDWGDFSSFNVGVGPVWVGFNWNATPLVIDNGLLPTHVQVALGAYDLCGLFGFPCSFTVPGPIYDNVRLSKFRIGGPTISLRTIDTFMDGFPPSGETDFHTLAGRQNADVRLDIKDISTGLGHVPGDSMVTQVVPGLSGTTVQSVELEWVMDLNPKFDDVRVMPSGTTVIAGGATNGWDQWSGTEVGQPSLPTPDWYFFDLPDVDFFHPGDVLRFYVRATDNQASVSTLPADLDGFATGYTSNGGLYDPDFTTRALPSVVDDGQGGWAQPGVLVVNDFRTRGATAEYYKALAENGWSSGSEYDIYTVRGASRGVSNGIGSAGFHGATPAQLGGYSTILYLTGDLARTVSDGSFSALNDKSDDIGVLTSWFDQDEDRFLAHFGDDLVSSLYGGSLAGQFYAQTVLGVGLVDDDVSDDIGLTAPLVKPLASSCFDNGYQFAAFGGCQTLNDFDYVEPLAGAVATHQFCDTSGAPIAGPAASVFWERVDGNGNMKKTATFPYGLVYVWDPAEPEAAPEAMRSRLVLDLFENCFGQLNQGSPTPTTPAVRTGAWDFAVHPNPFNPRTSVAFELGRDSHATVRVFDLRGALVRVLHDGMLQAGPQRLDWDGRDQRDRGVASGVYMIEVKADGTRHTTKVALVK